MLESSTQDDLVYVRLRWTDLLRANCIALAESPHLAQAVSISRRIEGDDIEAVGAVARLLGQEYGLHTEVLSTGSHLTVRYSRP